MILDNLNTSVANLSNNALVDINNYYSQYQNLMDWYNRLPHYEKKSDVRPDLFNIVPNKDDEMEYYYNKHRVIIDLCDDIALFNGYSPNELPSHWTVLRQMLLLHEIYSADLLLF